MCSSVWFSNTPKSKISSISQSYFCNFGGWQEVMSASGGSWGQLKNGCHTNTHRLLISHHPKQNIAAFPDVAVGTSARQAVKEWMWAEEAPAPAPEGLSWYKNHLLRSLLFTHQTPWRESWHTFEQLFLVTVFPISPTTFNTQNLPLASEGYVLGKKTWT